MSSNKSGVEKYRWKAELLTSSFTGGTGRNSRKKPLEVKMNMFLTSFDHNQ
jgi:hypothetical protein